MAPVSPDKLSRGVSAGRRGRAVFLGVLLLSCPGWDPRPGRRFPLLPTSLLPTEASDLGWRLGPT